MNTVKGPLLRTTVSKLTKETRWECKPARNVTIAVLMLIPAPPFFGAIDPTKTKGQCWLKNRLGTLDVTNRLPAALCQSTA